MVHELFPTHNLESYGFTTRCKNSFSEIRFGNFFRKLVPELSFGT